MASARGDVPPLRPYIAVMTATLYNTEILRLAASIPYQERLADAMAGPAGARAP